MMNEEGGGGGGGGGGGEEEEKLGEKQINILEYHIHHCI
jgi:hypothetical protein